MLLVNKSGQYIQDQWQYIGSEDTIPANGNLVIALERWAEIETLPVRKGIWLSPDNNVADIARLLPDAELVLIDFPKFRDGRGFTQAKLIRERYRFKGDIRAGGHVLPDQFSSMITCGFSSAKVAETFPEERWIQAALLVESRKTSTAPGNLLNRLVSAY
ncbi:oxidoreductase [Advenella faeciporci]|uniref:Oxidoreductase n=1 Tax=Advenella faeciporci TaxID=797535 RepID=A0A918N010_9BURK|nr:MULTISPECIES: DUF934 domain-containing protein [Advenella]WKU18113.1 DUF934 domain-containing protein [Advenella alkanexedens]GGW91343.1 oxidoreductase [Advenella faeciporci]